MFIEIFILSDWDILSELVRVDFRLGWWVFKWLDLIFEELYLFFGLELWAVDFIVELGNL